MKNFIKVLAAIVSVFTIAAITIHTGKISAKDSDLNVVTTAVPTTSVEIVSETTIPKTTTTTKTTTNTTTTEQTTVKQTTTVEATTTTTITTTKIPETTTAPEAVEEVTKTYYDSDRFSERRPKDNWLFIGDSRFEFWYKWGFYGTYIAKSGQGLNMIYDNYDEIISYRNYNVVFNLGANQWWSGWEYVNLLNSLPDEFTKNNHIVVVSVTPADGRFSYLNPSFDNYNEIVRNNLRQDYEYFDLASYLKDNGFITADGLHYTTYQDGINYNFLVYGK